MPSPQGVSHSIWTHPHFVLAVAAQFFYVAAQAGIFSFFINYMTAEVAGDSGRLGIRHGASVEPGRFPARLAAGLV